MTEPESPVESLDQFAQSLSYGERSDLSFKFLSRFDATGVGDAMQAMLSEIGSLFDTGDPGALIDLAIELQSAGYHSRPLTERYHYDDSAFTRPQRPVAECQIALLTSSGHFVAGDDPQPFGVDSMTQSEAEGRISEFLKEKPILSEIPVDSTPDVVEVRHGGYDTRGSVADYNVSLPIDRLRELDGDGVIGSLHPTAYSFVGACAQMPLVKTTGPEWADRLKATGSDVVLLVPV
jgi:D-proline reductase (dithiol) PrdB